MMEAVGSVREVTRLNRASWRAGVPEMILINTTPQTKYPTEVAVFTRNYNPLADRFIPTPPPAPTLNGQHVNTATHLMCSKCCQWKLDAAFYMDRSRVVRRGRRYYCMDCVDRSRLYCSAEEAESPRARRKKRRKE